MSSFSGLSARIGLTGKICLAFFLFIFLLSQSASAFFTGWLGREQEISLGKEVAKNYEREYGTKEVPRITAVGKKMIPYTGTDYQYHFKVLLSDEPNAMAIMGGFVYINRGLLKIIDTEDELAFVLGHEMAHIANRHMVKNVEKGISGGFILQLVFGRAPELTQKVVAIAWNLTQLGYSRQEEYEADHCGVSYVIRAGYNPRAAVSLMKKLMKLGGSGGPEFLMSHPDMQKRIQKIKNDYSAYF